MKHAWTLGVEEEYFLVDSETFDAAPTNQLVLRQCDHDGVDATAEMQACTVEIGTPVCADAAEVEQAVLQARRDLADRAARFGCRLAAVPTHPFAGVGQTISDAQRYRAIADQYGWVADRTMTCGMHVHIGIPNMDHGVTLLNDLRGYAPLLLALTANSPFVDGIDTGLSSVRNRVGLLYPRQGIPPAVESWDDYELQLRALSMAGFVHDHRDLWWAVRLHPTWQTVEVRICDVQLTANHAAAVAALMQALCMFIDEDSPEGGRFAAIPDVLFEENMWSAARHGTAGQMLDLATLEPGLGGATSIPTRVALECLVDRLTPFMQRAGNGACIPTLHELIIANGACRQRAFVERDASLVDLMREIVSKTVEDSADVSRQPESLAPASQDISRPTSC
ncbi:MAG: YbdK family carboxylate-amine ligase [Thermoleophilia bacterium]|nr:YbdK family carboxylate-amine ligase [Thermoleophilia bacterium]